MKMIWALAFAASTLAFSGAAEAAGKTATHHRHLTRSEQAAPVRHHARRYAAKPRGCDCWRERVARGGRPYDWVEPLRLKPVDDEPAPTLTNDYYFQESMYDFIAGKRANIKEYPNER